MQPVAVAMSPAQYFRWVFGTMMAAGALWLGLLVVSRELFTTSDGLAYQLQHHSVYGREVFADDHYYKRLLSRQRRPRVLALGSSRTMSFRDVFFDESQRFMTAGGAMQSLAEGRAFVDEMIGDGVRPEVILLGLDYWWFNDNSGVAAAYLGDDSKYESYVYVVAASAVALPRLMTHAYRLDPLAPPFTRGGAVGARARAFGDGFRLDGSHNAAGYYTGTVRDVRTVDPAYSYTLGRIRSETHPFESGRDVSPAAMSQYIGLLDQLRAQGIKVIVFLPPFPPEVADALVASSRHQILTSVRSVVAKATAEHGTPFYDFTTVPFADRRCYQDGFHADQYVYAWITRQIAARERTANEWLDRLLNDPSRACEGY